MLNTVIVTMFSIPVKMMTVQLQWYSCLSIIDGGDPSEVGFPVEVGIPQFIRSEVSPCSNYSPFKQPGIYIFHSGMVHHYNMVFILPYFFRYKTPIFFFKNITKNLDLSYNLVNLWDCLGGVKLVL